MKPKSNIDVVVISLGVILCAGCATTSAPRTVKPFVDPAKGATQCVQATFDGADALREFRLAYLTAKEQKTVPQYQDPYQKLSRAVSGLRDADADKIAVYASVLAAFEQERASMDEVMSATSAHDEEKLAQGWADFDVATEVLLSALAAAREVDHTAVSTDTALAQPVGNATSQRTRVRPGLR